MTSRLPDNDFHEINKARWNEVVEVHFRSPFYRVRRFLAGEEVLLPIESEEIGPIAGRRLLHLQCHFGLDTLSLARRGSRATGLDFAPNAIAKARELSALAQVAARFVEGGVYDAPQLIPERFEIVYVTWGAICWLPDIRRWAGVVAEMLEPDGFLYLLEGHPSALALEQTAADGPILPSYDYFQGTAPLIFRDEGTYADPKAKIVNRESHEWNHGLGQVLTALVDAGLRIEWLHEHDRLAWPLFKCLEEGSDRMYHMPAGRPRLPLSYSLKARRP
jgi:SAM-dependent methyltransferase